MKFKWIIQDVNLTVSQMYKKFDALSHMGEKISGVGVIKNYDYVSGLEDAIEEDIDTKYILLTGVKVLNLIEKAKTISDVVNFPTDWQVENGDRILEELKNGFYYDYGKFDQAYYGTLDLPLLNNKSDYISLNDNLKTSFSVDKFVKPSRDLKAFDAGILKANETVETYLKSKSKQRFYLDEKLVVADVITMCDEYRFFVIDGKVSSGSAYRVNGVVGVSLIVPYDVQEKADEYAKLYQPADVFTMDLARLKDGSIKIIEYNCFNCSGVYLNDLVKTYSDLKDYIYRKSLNY